MTTTGDLTPNMIGRDRITIQQQTRLVTPWTPASE